MRALFEPGIKIIGLFGPIGRTLLIGVMFLLPLLLAFGFAQAPWTPVVTFALFVLAAYLLASFTIRGQAGMGRVSGTLERIALGDLSVRAHTTGEGTDIDRMWESIGLMSQSLGDIVKQVDGKPVVPKLLRVSGSLGKVKP